MTFYRWLAVWLMLMVIALVLDLWRRRDAFWRDLNPPEPPMQGFPTELESEWTPYPIEPQTLDRIARIERKQIL